MQHGIRSLFLVFKYDTYVDIYLNLPSCDNTYEKSFSPDPFDSKCSSGGIGRLEMQSIAERGGC